MPLKGFSSLTLKDTLVKKLRATVSKHNKLHPENKMTLSDLLDSLLGVWGKMNHAK